MPEIAAKLKSIPDVNRGRVLHYGLAPTTVALALAARALLAPLFHVDTVFLYFVPPILVSAGIGGFGPGLLATALGLLAAFFAVVAPQGVLSIGIANGIAFAIIGALTVLAILGVAVAHGGIMGMMQSFGDMMAACRNMMATMTTR